MPALRGGSSILGQKAQTELKRLSDPKNNATVALKALSEWVLQTGAQSAIRSHIVEVMELPAMDMPVRERGFRITGETMTHVC